MLTARDFNFLSKMHMNPNSTEKLVARLENWARAQHGGAYRGASIGSIEGRYRSGYLESKPSPVPIDYVEAELVNAAWQRLIPLDRDVLKMHYIWRAHSSFICRRLKIKHRPPEVWLFALRHAHDAIRAQLA